MSLLSSFAVALALAMDAFAVALSSSVSLGRADIGHYVRMSLAFGFFQFAMPVIGWTLGLSVRSWIEAWDHWIAFALLLAVATSIDALAVGLSFSMAGISVWMPSAVIGLVCAALTALGIRLGTALGRSELLGGKAALLGAFVLIGIGVNILHEHGVF